MIEEFRVRVWSYKMRQAKALAQLPAELSHQRFEWVLLSPL
jgi:hypothetical protein